MKDQLSKAELLRVSPCDYPMMIALAIGVLSGALIGFVLGWLWVSHWRAWSGVRILDVLTAAGTIGAVVVAVGLHREKAVRSLNEQRRRAQLYALETRVALQYFQNLGNALVDANFRMISSVPTQAELDNIDWLAGQISGFEQVLKIDIARFDCLSTNIPRDLAVGIGQLAQGALAAQATVKFIASHAPNAALVQQEAAKNHLWLSGGASALGRATEALAPNIVEAMRDAR